MTNMGIEGKIYTATDDQKYVISCTTSSIGVKHWVNKISMGNVTIKITTKLIKFTN